MACYRMLMIKRTSLNLEFDLVAEAREVLETNGTTDTVHRALEEVVRRDRVRRLAGEPFEDLTLEALEQLRGPRSW
jgi:Arc/MetJ family transcription regulator